MINIKKLLIICALTTYVSAICAQEVFVEASGMAGSGEFAPTWLTANKSGLASPYNNSAYERAGINGTWDIDTTHQVNLDYALDMQLSQNAQSSFFIHEAYAELSWKKLRLLVGQKEHTLDFRNDHLTSGGLGHGINARPLPKVLLNVDYFSMPGTKHWWKVRGRVGYGKTTDGNWQEDWVTDGSRYTSNHLYCERAIMFKFGREEKFPLTFEISLQMMTQFGGTSYNSGGRNYYDMKPIKHPENLNAFWHAVWPMGSSDVTDGDQPNSAGNTFGSYVLSLKYFGNYNAAPEDQWYVNAYLERMFEDQSMLTVQYGLYDHLLGLEFGLKKNPYVSHVVVEHISSTDQAGPVYHDNTQNIPESYCGQDNYYNHNLYTGWQHWGVGMGNPLFVPPIYNIDHVLQFKSNRLRAWHFAVDGNPTSELSWRIMASFTRNWGTYALPYQDIMSQQYYLVEASYAPHFLSGWKGTLGIAHDSGDVLPKSTAVQLTIRKTLKL